MSNIHGIIGYTITPFTPHGEGVDLDALGEPGVDVAHLLGGQSKS